MITSVLVSPVYGGIGVDRGSIFGNSWYHADENGYIYENADGFMDQRPLNMSYTRLFEGEDISPDAAEDIRKWQLRVEHKCAGLSLEYVFYPDCRDDLQRFREKGIIFGLGRNELHAVTNLNRVLARRNSTIFDTEPYVGDMYMSLRFNAVLAYMSVRKGGH